MKSIKALYYIILYYIIYYNNNNNNTNIDRCHIYNIYNLYTLYTWIFISNFFPDIEKNQFFNT